MVRCAAEREFGRREPEPIGRATFNHRDRLERLGGRSVEDHRIRIAQGSNEPSLDIDNGDHPLMHALDDAAARHFR